MKRDGSVVARSQWILCTDDGAVLGQRTRADEEHRLHAHRIEDVARGFGVIDQAVVEGDQHAVARQVAALQHVGLDLLRRRDVKLRGELLELLRESVGRDRMNAGIRMRVRRAHIMIVDQEKLSAC